MVPIKVGSGFPYFGYWVLTIGAIRFDIVSVKSASFKKT